MSEREDPQPREVARDWDYLTVGLLLNPINSRLAPLIARAGIHPNLITVISFLCAVGAGALWALSGSHHVIASVLLLVSFWLDGLDGHVARVAGKTSKWGGILDAVLDRVGECVVLGCIAAGAWMESSESLWLLVGLISVGIVQVYYYTVDRFLVPNLRVAQRALVPITRRLRPGLMEVYYVLLIATGVAGYVRFSLPALAGIFFLGFVIQLVRIRIAVRRRDG